MHNHEGQHGDNKPGHHDSAAVGEGQQGSGMAEAAEAAPGHHDSAPADHHGGTAPSSDHHAEEASAGDEGSSGDHHSEQPPQAAPKTHTHSDGKEHLHES